MKALQTARSVFLGECYLLTETVQREVCILSCELSVRVYLGSYRYTVAVGPLMLQVHLKKEEKVGNDEGAISVRAFTSVAVQVRGRRSATVSDCKFERVVTDRHQNCFIELHRNSCIYRTASH